MTARGGWTLGIHCGGSRRRRPQVARVNARPGRAHRLASINPLHAYQGVLDSGVIPCRTRVRGPQVRRIRAVWGEEAQRALRSMQSSENRRPSHNLPPLSSPLTSFAPLLSGFKASSLFTEENRHTSWRTRVYRPSCAVQPSFGYVNRASALRTAQMGVGIASRARPRPCPPEPKPVRCSISLFMTSQLELGGVAQLCVLRGAFCAMGRARGGGFFVLFAPFEPEISL